MPEAVSRLLYGLLREAIQGQESEWDNMAKRFGYDSLMDLEDDGKLLEVI
jgi:hypothetical protein